MLGNEIRDAVMIGIGLTLMASLLGFVMYLMALRTDFAEVRNAEVQASMTMTSIREFQVLESETLYAEEVISLIRDYMGSEVAVKTGQKAGALYSHKQYDKLVYKNTPSNYDLALLRSTYNPYIGSTLVEYSAYLVYGGQLVADISCANPSTIVKSSDSKVTGILLCER